MTATYDKLGIHFLYPENWKLLDETDATPHVITLEAPDRSSTWSVHVYDLEAPEFDPDDVFKETLDALQDTYPDVEVSPLEDDDKCLSLLEGLPHIDGDSIQGVEAMFYCLDFLIQARLYRITTARHHLLIWTQAEDRDFEQQELVFSAISASLLQPKAL